jgi:hypothetical protein
MPPYLSKPHYHLSRLPLTTKIALTFFQITLLAAIAFVVFAVFEERTHFSTEGVKVNYGGSERVAAETGEIPDVFAAEKSTREIYDIIHPHSFMIPIIFFILCHMMEMTSADFRLKVSLYVLSGISMLAAIFAPLLIHTNLSAAVILVPSVTVLMGAFAIMCILPLLHMWRGEPARKAG